MKRWILLFFVLVAAFVYYHRDRVFVRDPLASVIRDGTRQAGTQVYVNYNSDVLLEQDTPTLAFALIEHEQPVGAPPVLKCIHYLVCLTDSYTISPDLAAAGARVTSMTRDKVIFQDGQAREMVVQLH